MASISTAVTHQADIPAPVVVTLDRVCEQGWIRVRQDLRGRFSFCGMRGNVPKRLQLYRLERSYPFFQLETNQGFFRGKIFGPPGACLSRCPRIFVCRHRRVIDGGKAGKTADNVQTLVLRLLDIGAMEPFGAFTRVTLKSIAETLEQVGSIGWSVGVCWFTQHAGFLFFERYSRGYFHSYVRRSFRRSVLLFGLLVLTCPWFGPLPIGDAGAETTPSRSAKAH